MEEFKNWREIKDWATEHGYDKMAERMQLNNDAWNSSGEFGRNQVAICDAMRAAKTEEEREEIAKSINEACQENLGLW
ncbi:MAG: hypothetical protein IIY54_10580 [Ruminococcus sp.]|nr:hypothetical protein [Ruminococcus sp.]MBQ1310143.1 hypothetical protein [Ruminococcus sp.]